jgi:glycosyltransferase involved in cell wall biosynthesis
VARCDLVHSGVAGWPYPLGLIANPMALLLGKPLVIVVESAFWRISNGADATRRARARARLNEAFARWSVRNAGLAVFTSTAYRDSLGGGRGGLVAPATWISERDVLDSAAAEAAWRAKAGPLRLVFASRLTTAKGTAVLLEAARELDRRRVAAEIDILGAGDLRPDCQAAARGLRHVRMAVLDPVPYGPEFHAVLRRYHAAIVPTLSDEQPRIVYDAYAQAVPVLASDTGGNRECVEHGVTGVLVPTGDARALTGVIAGFADRPQRLADYGMRSLALARTRTHEAMHRVRAEAVAALLAKTR